MVKPLLVVCIAAFLATGSIAWTADMKKDLVPKLQKTLNDFAKKNSLNDSQMAGLLGAVVLDEEKIRKGGVGVVDKDVYVLLNESRNTLSTYGKEWKGRVAGEPEIVVVDDSGEVHAIRVASGKNLKIVVFSPSEVKFIDVSKNSGGRYIRSR
jgi:hypothetical protein